MERIRAAIEKAREERADLGRDGAVAQQSVQSQIPAQGQMLDREPWDFMESIDLDPKLLTSNRIVSQQQNDPAFLAYDMLRTRVVSASRTNSWNVIGITSPTAKCGKTVTAINLSFSLARQRDMRVLLLDADLRRPMVFSYLGAEPKAPLDRFLSGQGRFEDYLVKASDSLAIGGCISSVKNTAELLGGNSTGEAMEILKTELKPDLIIVDLPPMLVTDDVMAFLPQVDACLLVSAINESKISEIDECERELSDRSNVMGVVINKGRNAGTNYGYSY